MNVVVDASFAGAWVLPDESSGRAEALLQEIAHGGLTMLVPDLWSYEMLNLLVTAGRRRRIDPDEVERAIELVDAIPCAVHDHRGLLARQRLARLCGQFPLSACAAAYLELADRFRAPLYTLDDTLAAAAASLGLAAGGAA